jgi:AcrR family transcriptional regulator
LVASNASQLASAASGLESPARARILAAATEVFGTFGFTKATVQEIAHAAHVSKPLFYRNFSGKQDVFEAVIDRVFTEWRETLGRRLAANHGETGEALRVLFLESLEYGRTRPFLGRLLTRDSQLLLSTQSEVWKRACLALQQVIQEILERGVAADEVRSDLPVDHMADLLTEIHLVYANRQLLTGVALEPARAESLVASMLDGVVRRSS